MKKQIQQTTDWNRYYQAPFKTACWSRRIVRNTLLRLFYESGLTRQKDLCILEAGGGNSCFYQAVAEHLKPVRYCVLDQHQESLDQLVRRIQSRKNIIPPEIIRQNVLESPSPDLQKKFDMVFSVGLIEHFSSEGTQGALQFHLDCVKPGGLVIVFFPTPTILYRIIRKAAELTGLWIFHDERPLTVRELLPQLQVQGNVLKHKILYAMFLTQAFIVLRKNDD